MQKGTLWFNGAKKVLTLKDLGEIYEVQCRNFLPVWPYVYEKGQFDAPVSKVPVS